MGGSAEIAIVGGGVMGMSLAFWLVRMGARDVAVIEPDPSLARSSTARSAASIRQQFSTPVNVALSRFGIEFIRNVREFSGLADIPEALDLVENGYLFLADTAAKAEAMRAVAAVQRAAGAATDLLEPAALAARFPHLETGDVVLASYGPRDEGWFDNMALHATFRSAALRDGARIVKDRVTALRLSGGRVAGVDLASGATLAAPVVVNAAGTAAARIMGSVGEDIPVEPRKRTVFVIHAPEASFPDAPLTIDPSGIWFRPEGKHWLAATVPAVDGPCAPDDFEPDWRLFEDFIWERLHDRCRAFAALKVVSAWAGHYAFNTLDQNAIVGAWPGLPGLYVMNGFSGHGLQQAPGVGRGLAELILAGGYRSLDLSALSPDRLAAGAPLLETAVV